MKIRNIAILLAIFLGGLGVHRFYLKQWKYGLAYLLFCWTLVPFILGIIDAFIWAFGSTENWDLKFNTGQSSMNYVNEKYPKSNKTKRKIEIERINREREERKVQIESILQESRKKQFENLKPTIDAGLPVSLSAYEEKNLRPFMTESFPNTDIKIFRPQEISTTIAGFQYHDGYNKEVTAMLRNEPYGTPLSLKRDPDNPHSKERTATQIHWNNYFLGFIPSEYSKIVSEAIDKGLKVSSTINEYNPSASSFLKVSIDIRIDFV
jgi:TM2 domain-containing membrane protein YozV